LNEILASFTVHEILQGLNFKFKLFLLFELSPLALVL
jgi:hypothetical protein